VVGCFVHSSPRLPGQDGDVLLRITFNVRRKECDMLIMYCSTGCPPLEGVAVFLVFSNPLGSAV